MNSLELFILGQKVIGPGNDSQKCRRGSLHSCECSLLLVVNSFFKLLIFRRVHNIDRYLRWSESVRYFEINWSCVHTVAVARCVGCTAWLKSHALRSAFSGKQFVHVFQLPRNNSRIWCERGLTLFITLAASTVCPPSVRPSVRTVFF